MHGVITIDWLLSAKFWIPAAVILILALLALLAYILYWYLDPRLTKPPMSFRESAVAEPEPESVPRPRRDRKLERERRRLERMIERERMRNGPPDEPPDESRTEPPQVAKDQEFIALGMFDDRLKVVAVTPGGRYRVLDEGCVQQGSLYVVTRETQALADAVEELEDLINNRPTKEQDLQSFFERHKDFILTDDYVDARSKIQLVSDDGELLIPDFMLEPADQSSLCDILELKRPSAKVFVMKQRRMRYSQAVQEACAQLRRYSKFFDERAHRERIEQNYGLKAYRPKMFVIIGRRGTIDPFELRDMQDSISGIEVRTYDQVLERAKAKVERWRMVGRA